MLYLPSNQQHEALYVNRHNKKARDVAMDDRDMKAESIVGPVVSEETERWLQDRLSSATGEFLKDTNAFAMLDKARRLMYLYQILEPHVAYFTEKLQILPSTDYQAPMLYLPSNQQHEALYVNRHNKKARDVAMDDRDMKAESIVGPVVSEETERWLQDRLSSATGEFLKDTNAFAMLDKARRLMYLYQILEPHVLVLVTISHYDLSSNLPPPSLASTLGCDQLLYDLDAKELDEGVDPPSFVLPRRALSGRINEDEVQRGKRKEERGKRKEERGKRKEERGKRKEERGKIELEKEIERTKKGSTQRYRKHLDCISEEFDEEEQ
ncbi:hypothetical protein BT69DRAFT_1302480 [Atractiella rhizophila]|nr:hypothetical protein BT69DRAFT_1302480 [Atractiella rhizophila]